MNIDQIAATVVESLYGADESRVVTRDDALAIAKLAAGMSNSEFAKIVSGRAGKPTGNEDIDQIIYALERARDANNRLANKLLDQRDYSAEMPAADAECIQQGIDLLMGLARHWQVAKREPPKNTIYVEGYDAQGKRVLTGSRSSFDVSRDHHIGDCAIEFFYAVKRGVDIDPATLWKHVMGSEPPTSKAERAMRRMLCAQRHGGRAYMDDGEAQFGGDEFCRAIDYLRESPEAIEQAWRDANIKRAEMRELPGMWHESDVIGGAPDLVRGP